MLLASDSSSYFLPTHLKIRMLFLTLPIYTRPRLVCQDAYLLFGDDTGEPNAISGLMWAEGIVQQVKAGLANACKMVKDIVQRTSVV
jgi:hypothetical protein